MGIVSCVNSELADEIKREDVGHQSYIEVSVYEKLFW